MLIWSGVIAMTRIIMACFFFARQNMQYSKIGVLVLFVPRESMPRHLESCHHLWRFVAARYILLVHHIGRVPHNRNFAVEPARVHWDNEEG